MKKIRKSSIRVGSADGDDLDDLNTEDAVAEFNPCIQMSKSQPKHLKRSSNVLAAHKRQGSREVNEISFGIRIPKKDAVFERFNISELEWKRLIREIDEPITLSDLKIYHNQQKMDQDLFSNMKVECFVN